MNKIGIHSRDEAGTGRRVDSRTAMYIGTSLIAALIVLFLLSTVFRGNSREPAGALQTAPQDTLQVETTVPDTAITDTASSKPDFWLQARGSSTGNAAWGPDVTAPFDTLWLLESGGGREFFSSPALVEGTLYFGCNDGKMRAVDAESGSVLLSFSSVCGICGEPAVDSSTVYFGGQDGYVYALRRTDGGKRWSAGLGYHVFCDTGIMCDSLVLSGNSMGKICALSATTGEPLWDRDIGGIVLGPAVMDTIALFTTENGNVTALDQDGNVLWSKDYSGQASPPSADSAYAYVAFSGGMVRKFDLKTGSVVWEKDVVNTSGRCVLARPVICRGLVLVGTNDSRLVCLDGSGGDIVWEQSFENWLQLPPAVGDEIVYLACDDQRLHLLELDTGDRLDSLEMGGYSGTAPLVSDGIVYYGNTSGEFRALRGSIPQPEQADTTMVSVDSSEVISEGPDSLLADSSETLESSVDSLQVQVQPLEEPEEDSPGQDSTGQEEGETVNGL